MENYKIVLGQNFKVPDEDCIVQFEIVNLGNEKKSFGLVKLFEIPTNADKLFLNNWQSWGSCDFIPVEMDVSKYFEKKEARDFILSNTIEPELFLESNNLLSDYFIAFDDMFMGFLRSDKNHAFFVYDKEKKSVSAYADLFGRKLDVGEKLTLESLVILRGEKLERLLEEYASLVASENNLNADKKMRVGWCSWYHYFTDITYEELKKNISILKRLRDEKGLPYRFVQIDDGYQKDIGDWLVTNSKFPEGLTGIVRAIKEAGFIPGIWLAPFSISETSSIFLEHPDWLVKTESGEPKLAYRNWNKNIYALDLSSEEVLNWLKDLFKSLKEKGFDYFKIDFLFAGAIPGKREKDISPIEAYRLGMKVIREAIGDSFLLGCGAPLLPSIGLVDGMRISADTAPYWKEDTIVPFPNAKVALRNVVTRYFMHQKWWNNDPDCLLLRNEKIELSENERKLYSLVSGALSGMILESDDMELVDENGLNIFRDSLNLCGGKARVFNLKDDKRAYVIGVKGLKEGNYLMVANLENEEVEIEVPKDAIEWTGIDRKEVKVSPRDVVVVRDEVRKLRIERTRRKDDNRLVNYYWDGDEK